MDPGSDPLAASAPFPTIPAATHRPRVAKPRRQAAPFRSDHPVASCAPGRRLGCESPSSAFGARPSTAGAVPVGSRSATFFFGGDAASDRGAAENPASFSSWSSSRDANFVFGSGMSGASQMKRSSSFGSGDVSLCSLSATVEELILDGSSGKQSDADVDVSIGSNSVLEMNVGDSCGAHASSLNFDEVVCPSTLCGDAKQPDERRGVPSLIIRHDRTKTISPLAGQGVNSAICTDKKNSVELAKDGGNASVQGSVDSTKNGSKISANRGDVEQNFFVFGERASARHRQLGANTALSDIKKVASANKEDVMYSSEHLDPSASEDSACIKLQTARGSVNRDPPHLGPNEVSETEKASNTAPYNFGSQDDIAKISLMKLPDGMQTQSTVVAASGLGECRSLDETSFTLLNHNADCFSGKVTPETNFNLKEIATHANSVQSLPTSAIGLAHSDVTASQPSAVLSAQLTEYSKAEPKTVTCTKTEIFGNQQVCETWRIRGNQAYAAGQLAKAEECYTHGINSVSPSEASQKALMLCYSNRAATRMSVGRVREALSDCRKAIDIDSSFLKAQVRAANCLLALGDVEEAQKGFKICLKSNHAANLDYKIIEEASDGLQKAQKVSNFMLQSKEYLVQKAFDKIPSALQMISDALSISIYSDNLMEMKAEALFLLRRYEDVICFCEETLHLAERNSLPVCLDENSTNINLGNYSCSVKLWRYYLIAKSYFFIGKLEEAHQFLKKHEQATLLEYRCGKQSLQSLSSLSKAISELLRIKAAGNEAFQAGKYSEAVEHYTAALLSNTESLHFSAICFGNRAAAYQAMGQILDAIADCSLAIALDTKYCKAISRRASLYELIRDYRQAENDLRRLISLLEKQLQENLSMPSEKSDNIRYNLHRANLRLSALERDARKGASLNIYLILGIEPSCSAADIKKAYRKAALRHHPDKAGNFLVRSENIDDTLWREIANEIRRDADYLFKIIGEAYAILSDPTMKSKMVEHDTWINSTSSRHKC